MSAVMPATSRVSGNTLSSYVGKLNKKDKSHIIAHISSAPKTRSHRSILATFKFAIDKSNIHEGAAMTVSPHYVQETLTNTLCSRMSSPDRLALLAISVQK